MFWHILVRNDIADRRSPANFQHTKQLAKQLRAVLGLNQIQHTIRNNAIDAVAGNHRLLAGQSLFQSTPSKDILDPVLRQTRQFFFKLFQIESKVLDNAASKIDIGMSDLFGHFLFVLPSQRQHLRVTVNANHLTFGTNNLRSDIAKLAAARTEIQNRFSLVHKRRRITATVVALDDLIRNHFQKISIVFNRTTKGGFSLFRCF